MLTADLIEQAEASEDRYHWINWQEEQMIRNYESRLKRIERYYPPLCEAPEDHLWRLGFKQAIPRIKAGKSYLDAVRNSDPILPKWKRWICKSLEIQLSRGDYTREAIERREMIKTLLKETKELIR